MTVVFRLDWLPLEAFVQGGLATQMVAFGLDHFRLFVKLAPCGFQFVVEVSQTFGSLIRRLGTAPRARARVLCLCRSVERLPQVSQASTGTRKGLLCLTYSFFTRLQVQSALLDFFF